ncbi:MAG: sulfatase-like hydrolase/transferase [Bacteroidales bacterium]|nr:sulfatase-like hydrolase/transferase [Lentimicrobiaceae bacterium]MDD5693839.1 sulfatase-like hydrolase/transferase [Bacteroidales bacterium]
MNIILNINIFKRISIELFMLSLLCMVTAEAPAQATEVNQQPNIIHILAAGIGYDDLGCYGATTIATPNLDRLAAEGVRLTGFYSPHGSGTASRAAILTGQYAPRMNKGAGLPDLTPESKTGLEPSTEVTIARLLKSRGYATAIIGNWQLGQLTRYLPINHGFEHFLGIPYAKDLGPERPGGAGLKNYPLIPLIRDTLVIQNCSSQDLAALPALFRQEACRFIRDAAGKGKPFYLFYAPVETQVPWYIPPGFEGVSQAGCFGDAVSFMDLAVGAILETLRDLGIEQNTLVVLSSDCGPQISRNEDLEKCYGKYARTDTSRAHQLRGGKDQTRYEGGIRVPCILRWPGVIPPKTKVDMITAGFDLFPTFAAAAGIPLPTGRIIDGKNLLPVLTGQQIEPVHLLFFGFEPEGMLMSVRYKNWKLAIPSPPTPGVPELNDYELYQLEKDPGERFNVAAKYPEIVDQLRQFGEKAKAALRSKGTMPEKNFIE